ncbi:TOG array regulator of axonemal microtubules protein 1-like isoform X2 [Brachyhypopomus gauderio]|uniref:TOG array regulator of axonemal microtubules protein 1-like isoform X2 n=1 Tax=Brachyhypopomus gauderio TaxID=698409 RepID=UPI004042CFE4
MDSYLKRRSNSQKLSFVGQRQELKIILRCKMDFRDLIEQHYKFSQSDCSSNSGTSTQDYMRDSPLQHPISSSKQLEMIEREQRQLQAVRVQKVKNLRSKVSCAAMTTLAYMFTYLRRAMDPEAAEAARVLLHKACESSAFIREDVDLALSAMVHSCSARRSIHALLAGGLSHRNATVRKTTAFHMESLAQLLGASKLLTGKDLTERFLSAISRLALDAAQEVSV